MSELQERLQASLGDAFHIERELGGGGMSHVFLARETALGRQVVIKVLPPEMSAAVNIERFRREIQLAASLQHPHIVPVHAAGQVGDLFYYTMPLVEGESLRAKLAREGELPVHETIKILMDVADGLAYAHARGVVHRDIKPDNILISGQHAVVTDFGVAKAVSAATGASSLTSIGVALGTPAYMAPEQAAADPHVDHRADLYALGAMAYEMLAGRPPFSGMSPQQVLAAHVTTAPTPVSSLRESVPPAINELVMRLLAEETGRSRAARDGSVVAAAGGWRRRAAEWRPRERRRHSRAERRLRLKRARPARVAMLFALASILVLAVVFVLRQKLGLPDWVLGGAAALLAIGLPIMLITGRKERERVMAAATGTYPVPEAGVAKYFTWRKAILGGGLSFGGLTAIVIGYTVMRVLGIGSVGTLQAKGLIKNRQPILLADFDNRAIGFDIRADAHGGAARRSFAVVDREAHERRGGVGCAQADAEACECRDHADAGPRLAQREGVPAIVAGEIDAVGRSYLVSAKIVSASTGEVLAAVRESAASDAELIPALDRLSRALRERIGESLVSIRATTSSGSLDVRSREQAAQHVREDAAVAQVLALARRVEADARAELLVVGAHGHLASPRRSRRRSIENSSRPVRPSDSALSPSRNCSGRMPIISRFERWIRS